MPHRRNLSRLRLCFWIALVVVAVDIASSAPENDATLPMSNSTTASPNSTTRAESIGTASSECWSFSNRSLYKRCVNETFPQLSSDAFVFTNDNKALLCSNSFCNMALREFARNVRADCTLVSNKTNISIKANEIQRLMTTVCVWLPSPSTTSPTPSTPRPTSVAASTSPSTAVFVDAGNDGERTLMFVGIAFGATLLYLCKIVGFANSDEEQTAWSTIRGLC